MSYRFILRKRVLLTDTFFYANHMTLLSELASKLFRA